MSRGKKAADRIKPAAATESPSGSSANTSAATPPPRPTILPITPTPSRHREVVKVNNSSPVELKNALDDAIKRVRSIIPPRSAIA